jgi:TolA-binding protein
MDNQPNLVKLNELESELRMVEKTIEKLTNKKVNLLTQIHNIKKQKHGSKFN